MFNFKLMSFDISCMHYASRCLLVATTAGDVLELKLVKEAQKVTSKRVPGILSVHPLQVSVSFVSEELPFLMVGGQNGVINTYDLRTNELIDTWAVGHSVHTLLSRQINLNFTTIVGCSEGVIYIRQDWDLVTTHYAGTDTINAVALTKNNLVLFAASEDCNIYVLRNTNSGFELYCFVTIDTGVPLSFDLSEDGSFALIATDKRKLMMSKAHAVNINSYEINFTYQNVASIRWPSFSGFFTVFYSQKSNERGHFKFPVAWRSKADAMAAVDAKGCIQFWSSKR